MGGEERLLSWGRIAARRGPVPGRKTPRGKTAAQTDPHLRRRGEVGDIYPPANREEALETSDQSASLGPRDMVDIIGPEVPHVSSASAEGSNPPSPRVHGRKRLAVDC